VHFYYALQASPVTQAATSTSSGSKNRNRNSELRLGSRLTRNRLRGHVRHQDLANNVMPQKLTSGPRRRESVLPCGCRLRI